MNFVPGDVIEWVSLNPYGNYGRLYSLYDTCCDNPLHCSCDRYAPYTEDRYKEAYIGEWSLVVSVTDVDYSWFNSKGYFRAKYSMKTASAVHLTGTVQNVRPRLVF